MCQIVFLTDLGRLAVEKLVCFVYQENVRYRLSVVQTEVIRRIVNVIQIRDRIVGAEAYQFGNTSSGTITEVKQR